MTMPEAHALPYIAALALIVVPLLVIVAALAAPTARETWQAMRAKSEDRRLVREAIRDIERRERARRRQERAQ